MIYYLIDASVAAEFYRPPASLKPEHLELQERIVAQKYSKNALLYIPAFCIPEVFNTFAKWWIRQESVFASQEQYEKTCKLFGVHIHDRELFYSYDLTRYHNLRCHSIFPVEHRFKTEFDVTGLPKTAKAGELDKKLKELDQYDHVGKHYLSAFDILIIAMGMELEMLLGKKVHLLTNDERLAKICQVKPEFPKSHYWRKLLSSQLPRTNCRHLPS